jgi:hypothetical protein
MQALSFPAVKIDLFNFNIQKCHLKLKYTELIFLKNLDRPFKDLNLFSAAIQITIY